MAAKNEFHPASAIFDLMGKGQLQELAADIKAHGLREPITKLEGKILDGRNRFLACQIAGVECEAFALDPDTLGDPVDFVISTNLHRRHLNESQRAMVAAKASNLKQGKGLETGKFAGQKQSEAAKTLGVSERSVRTARKVQKEGSKKLQAAVEKGEVAVSRAAAVLDKPKPKQLAAAKKKKPKSGKAVQTPKQKAAAILDELELRAGRQAPRLDDVAELLGDRGTVHRACLKALDAYLRALKDRKKQAR